MKTAWDDYTYDATHQHAVLRLSDDWSFTYDCNGNMTQRNISGASYNMTYDAESRMTAVSGSATPALPTMVTATVSKARWGLTTVYIGNYFEWSNSVGTKYYYAGARRVAMRVGSADAKWLLDDHLGSQTVKAASYDGRRGRGSALQGVGEKRYGTSGATPTSFRSTGQRRN